MVDPKKAAFPLTVEAFTALQEEQLSRKAMDFECEFFALIVEMSNEAYAAGRRRDLQTARRLMLAIAEVHTDDDPYYRHLCGLCRGWIFEGFRRGLETPAQPPTMPS